jgi:hypothetical protein
VGWTKLFQSHHEEWLEEQFEKLKADHAQQITDLKKAHADELNRAIEECARLRDEAQRIRLYLTPALQSVQLEPDKSGPPAPTEVPMGTPWQRILAREVAKQEKEWAARHVQPVETPVGEESNGGTN